MSENSTPALLEIGDYFTEVTYGPYKMRTVVNKILADLETGKVLPGPMFYTYCNKGYIVTLDDAKRIIAKEDAIEWTEAYLTKLVKRTEVPEVVVEDKYVGFENE